MIKRKITAFVVVSAVSTFALLSPAQATVLTYDLTPQPAAGAFIGSGAVTTVYGDRGAANSGEGVPTYTYSYDGGVADTPNIAVNYGTYNPANGQWWSYLAEFWDNGYVDATNSVITSGATLSMVLMLNPDDNYEVDLNSILVGVFGTGTNTARVQVWESIGNALDIDAYAGGFPFLTAGVDYNEVYNQTAALNASSNTFTPNIVSEEILWVLVTSTTDTRFIAYDNVDFDQNFVPEPGSMGLIAGGLALLCVRRRKR